MTKLRMIFPAVAIGASFTLAACSGLGGGTGQDQTQQQPASQGSQGSQGGQSQGQGSQGGQGGAGQNQATYTKDQITQTFEDLGYELANVPNSQGMDLMEDATIEPAECEALIVEAMSRGGEKLNDNTVIGTKDAGSMSLSASGVIYDSADEATKSLDQSVEQAGPCKDATMEIQGQKITMSVTAEKTNVNGADAAVKSTVSIAQMGNMDMTMITASKGNVVVGTTQLPLGQGKQVPAADAEKELNSNLEEILTKLG